MYPGKDPYYVTITGSTSTARTDETYRSRRQSFGHLFGGPKYYVDTWSRVDLATCITNCGGPRTEARVRARGGRLRALRQPAGGRPSRSPRRAATARPTSGASSIRPTNFDPAKKYPVIEDIYAGPQGSFVPKSFSAALGLQRWQILASSWCRSTAWGRTTVRRRFTMSRGIIWRTPASRIASFGTRR